MKLEGNEGYIWVWGHLVQYLLVSHLIIVVQWKIVHNWFHTRGHLHENLMSDCICHTYQCDVDLIPLLYMLKSKYVSFTSATHKCLTNKLIWPKFDFYVNVLLFHLLYIYVHIHCGQFLGRTKCPLLCNRKPMCYLRANDAILFPYINYNSD